jgi:hypothetical protein
VVGMGLSREREERTTNCLWMQLRKRTELS